MNDLVLYAGIYLVSVFISAVSQVLLKRSANRSHASALAEYLNPWVLGAYTIFFIATFLTIFAYRVVPLSLGPILEATSYIYILVFGAIFFGERVTVRKLAAIGLIIVGIVVYSHGI